jgi:hypothetical protein
MQDCFSLFESIAAPGSEMGTATGLPSDRTTASYTNICFVHWCGNKSKQFSRREGDRGASRAWNQQDLNIQSRLSDCDGVCIKGIQLEA